MYSSQSTSLLSDTVYQTRQVRMLVACVLMDHLALLKPIILKCAISQRTIQSKDLFLFFRSHILPCWPYFIFISSSYTLSCFEFKWWETTEDRTDGPICRTSSGEGTKRGILLFSLCPKNTFRWRCSLTDFSGLVKKDISDNWLNSWIRGNKGELRGSTRISGF
jgi:hypothetical protein